MLGGVVAQKTTGKCVSGISSDHAGIRPTVEIWIGYDALLKAFSDARTNLVECEWAVIHRVVDLHEHGHVHGSRITSNVKIISGIGGVGFDEVMGCR